MHVRLPLFFKLTHSPQNFLFHDESVVGVHSFPRVGCRLDLGLFHFSEGGKYRYANFLEIYQCISNRGAMTICMRVHPYLVWLSPGIARIL